MRRKRREYPTTRAKAVLTWRLVALIARRRQGREQLARSFIALAVTFTVAASFVVTCMIGRAGNDLVGRLVFPPIPADALLLSDGDGQIPDLERWHDLARTEEFQYVRVDSGVGPLLVLGLAKSAPPGTVLLSPDACRSVAEAGEATLALFDPSNGKPLGEWAVAPSEQFLPGDRAASTWAWVNPETAVAIGKAGPASLHKGLSFELFEKDQGSLDALASSFSGFRNLPVFMPESGRRTVSKALGAAYLPWQAVSAMAAVTAASSVGCVLAVVFLGRKRAFGILKVMGLTRADLWRLVLAEAAFLGLWGIPLGLALGWVVNSAVFKAPVSLVSYAAPVGLGLVALLLGAALPLLLIKNATCDQLLNNRPVHAISNPSCAQCGLCGGF